MLPFDEYFSSVYQNRWEKLRASLTEEPLQGVWANPWIPERLERFSKLTHLRGRLWIKKPSEVFAPERHSSGLLDSYILDPASVFVAEAVGAGPTDRILDMCAAPGGKSLVMFSTMTNGLLISNDVSQDRRFRMKKIFEQYIPDSERHRVQIKGWDGMQFGMRMPAHFDRVLLDAPCSGERHMMESALDLAEWKPKRAENLAKRQYGLLTSALLALKPGGTLVYSTCSINPAENDGVIERLLDRKGDSFKLEPLDVIPGAEKTKYGVHFFPDVCGYGPMFCCRIHKHEGVSPD